MKEVKFSWYDRVLVNLTVREKFHVLFWFPLLMILLITGLLLSQNNNLRQLDAVQALELKLQSSAALLEQVKDASSLQLPAGIRLSESGVAGQQQGLPLRPHPQHAAGVVVACAGLRRQLRRKDQIMAVL